MAESRVAAHRGPSPVREFRGCVCVTGEGSWFAPRPTSRYPGIVTTGESSAAQASTIPAAFVFVSESGACELHSLATCLGVRPCGLQCVDCKWHGLARGSGSCWRRRDRGPTDCLARSNRHNGRNRLRRDRRGTAIPCGASDVAFRSHDSTCCWASLNAAYPRLRAFCFTRYACFVRRRNSAAHWVPQVLPRSCRIGLAQMAHGLRWSSFRRRS